MSRGTGARWARGRSGRSVVCRRRVLGAVLGARPLRIGALLVAPGLVYLVVGRPDSWRNPAATLAVYAAFALFNGAAAGAGMTWAGDLVEHRKQRRS